MDISSQMKIILAKLWALSCYGQRVWCRCK